MTTIERNLPQRGMSTLQAMLHWGAWPFGLAVAGLAAWLLGHRPELATPLQMATMLAAVVIVVVAERVVPFRREWQRGSSAERRTDIASLAVLMMLADPLVKRGLLPLVATAMVPIVGGGGALGWFPTAWPVPAQLVLAAVIAEFGQYWMHRAAHTQRWMWGVHGFHHNPTRLYWLNGFRVNPLNMIWYQLAGLGVLVAIGTPPVIVQMLILFGTTVTVFQHANADLRLGGWNLVFGTADLHRWHHATGPGAPQVNFGAVLMLWDQVFGTYRGGRGAPEVVGVDAGAPRASGYLSGMAEAMRNASGRPAA